MTSPANPRVDRAALRARLETELAERLDGPEGCPILFALHFGCGAYALGIEGALEPASLPVSDNPPT